MTNPLIETMTARFGAAIRASGTLLEHDWVMVDPAQLTAIATYLRDDPQWRMDMPIDCTAVDYMDLKTPRFEVVYHLYSTKHHHRLRIKMALGLDELEVPSLTLVWPGMDWHEREAYDLYGVRFVGHPNLRRVLTYDAFEGHALRKDYPIDKRQPLIEMRDVRPVPTQRYAPPELLNRP